MNTSPNISQSPIAVVLGRMFATIAIALIGFGCTIVALAYYNDDVPLKLVYRWKHYPEFVPYFFASQMSAYASVGLALLAACCKPSRPRLMLIGIAVAAVIAHGMWEGQLRH